MYNIQSALKGHARTHRVNTEKNWCKIYFGTIFNIVVANGVMFLFYTRWMAIEVALIKASAKWLNVDALKLQCVRGQRDATIGRETHLFTCTVAAGNI